MRSIPEPSLEQPDEGPEVEVRIVFEGAFRPNDVETMKDDLRYYVERFERQTGMQCPDGVDVIEPVQIVEIPRLAPITKSVADVSVVFKHLEQDHTRAREQMIANQQRAHGGDAA